MPNSHSLSALDYDVDVVVVGSGFGGSVSALRLAEKGYSVWVLERGRRFDAQDFPKTNWNIWRYLWAPQLRCFGIQAISFLKDVMVLHGAGVGGGSLVYANTLMQPQESVFTQRSWPNTKAWSTFLRPYYQKARQMLGAVRADYMASTDKMLLDIAQEMGRAHTFHQPEVGVYTGTPGVEVDDPYFSGRGPKRSGCVYCGGCMVGCRHNAKNTLDKNYLHLAEHEGAKILPESDVIDIQSLGDNDHGEHGYAVTMQRSTAWLKSLTRRTIRCRQLVLAGGVMGTVPLLLKCKERGHLPQVSKYLGHRVRTNSEALTGATSDAKHVDHSKGLAIASGFYPNEHTHVQMVRYGAGQDFMGALGTPLIEGDNAFAPQRARRWLRLLFSRPLSVLKALWPVGFARRSGILLTMQPLDNHLRLVLGRRWWWPFGSGLKSSWEGEDRVPKYFPIANQIASDLAKCLKGEAKSVLPEVVFNLTSTAHILGGCVLAESKDQGVVDTQGRVFGYQNLWVVDGSVIPSNLAVNPSLTITALAESFMDAIPKAPAVQNVQN